MGSESEGNDVEISYPEKWLSNCIAWTIDDNNFIKEILNSLKNYSNTKEQLINPFLVSLDKYFILI